MIVAVEPACHIGQNFVLHFGSPLDHEEEGLQELLICLAPDSDPDSEAQVLQGCAGYLLSLELEPAACCWPFDLSLKQKQEEKTLLGILQKSNKTDER